MRRSFVFAGALTASALTVALVLASHAGVQKPVVPIGPVDEGAGARNGDDTAQEPDYREAPERTIHERLVDGPPVSLTASDGSGLVLAEMRASAVIEGPLAFTELRLAFDNTENRVREGTFKIVLPQGASLSRFAMKIGESWQEGEVVEKERARRAYEDFLHRKQDPALMEKGAGNEFSARVFPIPARGRKELIVSYAQELTGGAPYSLPLKGLPQLGVLDVSVGAAGGTPEREHHERYQPTADFVAEKTSSRGEAAANALRAGNLVVARVRPIAGALPDPVDGAVVLVDTSASRALGLGAEMEAVRSMLRALADRSNVPVPVTVAAFDQEVESIYHGDSRGFGDAEVERVVARRALGASDLGKALAWAKDEAKRTGAKRVVLVTDAVPTAGEEDAAKLAEVASSLKDGAVARLDVVAVGGLRDDALAHKLVTAGLAHDGVVAVASDGAAAIAEKLSSGTRSNVQVAVEGATWSYPTKLDGVQPGDETLVYAEMPENQAVRVKVGDRTVSFDAKRADRPLVERAWAQAKISSFEDEERDHGKSPELAKKIVDLSTSHRVLSNYTSLLVLETEADYARFHIDRKALADILTVDRGQLAWTRRTGVVRGGGRSNLPHGHAVATEAEKKKEDGADKDMSGAADPMAAGQAWGDSIGESFGAGGMGLSGIGEGAGGGAPAMKAAESMQMQSLGALGGSVAAGPMGAPAEAPRPAFAAPAPPMAVAPAATAAASGVAMDEARRAPASERDDNAGRMPMRAHASVARQEPMAGDDGVAPFTGDFKRVKDRLARRDAPGALTIASRWQAGAPGDVLALVALGEASEASHDDSTAARAYGSLIDLFPARADLRRFAGERLEHITGSASALDLAIDTFDKARKDRPDHPASHRLAAFARVRKGDYAGAFDVAVAGLAQRYPEGRFRGVDRILREDLGLIAAAWIHAEPAKRSDVLGRLRAAGGSIESGPSIRFVLNWETDANDVDFHILDSQGGHAYYGSPQLPSGGELYADVTTGYGPECFTIRSPRGRRAGPYRLKAHYFSRGPMGYGMGKLEIIDHDGKGGLKFEEREFVVMQDQAFVDLGTVRD